MVSLKSFTAAILALGAFAPALALPTESLAAVPVEAGAILDKRQGAAKIWYCEHNWWGGQCRGQEGSFAQCRMFPILSVKLPYGIAMKKVP